MCIVDDEVYAVVVPKLWTETVEKHRCAVRNAAIDAAARLIAQHGLVSVTMSKVAVDTGIGRATLYKYFPDVEAILMAWHERQVAEHLEQLTKARDQAGDAKDRLEAVLTAYAQMTHEQPDDSEIAILLHRGDHIDQAHRHLSRLIEDLIAEAASLGEVRTDVQPAELANYCLHALSAAASASSNAAVGRLVAVILAGLEVPRLRALLSRTFRTGPSWCRSWHVTRAPPGA
jgi:AcrR family transcriptional regulator